MTIILLALLPSIISLVIFLGIHIIIWRSSLGKRKGVTLLALIAGASYVITLISEAVIVGYLALPWHVWLSLPFYLFLVMLYFHFYVGIDRSVSIRIVEELAYARKAMRIEKIHARYSPDWMLQARCDLLVHHGWLIQKNGVYSCTKKGTILAKAAYIVQRWYRLHITG